MTESTLDNVKLNIKATNTDLTDDVRSYIERRVTKLGKLLKEHSGEVFVYFEIAKTTDHHENGLIYRADANVDIGGKIFYADAVKEDFRTAIDSVKTKLFREISEHFGKKSSLMRRGAAQFKKMLRFGK